MSLGSPGRLPPLLQNSCDLGHSQLTGSGNGRWALSAEGAKGSLGIASRLASLREIFQLLFWNLLEGGCRMGKNSAPLESPSWVSSRSLFSLPTLGTTTDQKGRVHCPRYTADV